MFFFVFSAPPTSINPGAGYKSDEMTTVNGDYGRIYNNGNGNGHNGAGQSDKPSPTENGGPGAAQTLTAELVKEKQERANVLQPKDAARSSLRPTKGANMHYNHTQLWWRGEEQKIQTNQPELNRSPISKSSKIKNE